MEEAREYQVNLEVFQGPLDLLLFLIRKKKIDIHDIPIASITREYLDYLDRKEKINLEREGEFLLIAALLIYIKSQMLLPRETLTEEEEDPRKVLVDHLLEYQKIKAASALLREKEDKQMMLWQRTALPSLPSKDELELTEVSLFDLAEVFLTLMKKKEQENIRFIHGKDYSLEVKMKELIDFLKENRYLDFQEYFDHQESIEEALVSFFCLLELIKARIVIAVQETLFRSIKVWLRQEARS
ncbi:MAG: segregation/condensation protein A [Candidatus Aminicenantes bacterium]|jgi:segregation and condensation protein A|nr:segregation/condensation protein A [Candidatus Aminicenantes bacterium]MDH5742284.1 segregation/condensation protein A [Candidatus Aminicenantes bacterium]